MMHWESLPKVELHVHLDGSVRPATLWELLQERRRAQRPAVQRYAGLRTVEEVAAKARVPDDCPSLADYLTRFDLPLAVMQDGEALERIAYELVADAAAEHVCHVEVRFAPALHTREGMTIAEAVRRVLAGLKRAEREFGVGTGLIACCMRHFPPEDNVAMVREVEPLLGEGLVAVDLAGDEAAFPTALHREPLALARRMGFSLTVHAGEVGGAEEIRTAVRELGATRIGHGVRLAEDPELLREVADRGVALEMCPTSNAQTKAVNALSEHPLRRYLAAGVAVTVNTDNRTVSATTLSEEYRRLAAALGLSESDARETVLCAAQAAFTTEDQRRKLFERIEREWPNRDAGDN
ncbi:MAG: adenosine deaminase [Firmicutes bacterium]|nr:adenosine deaminase [Bacillota bacterium]